MLDVIDSFSRRKEESAELLRSAAVVSRNTRLASSEISAWHVRDSIRRQEDDYDSRDYLTKSIRYVMRIGQEAQTRRTRYLELATAGQKKREQLVNDAQELRECDMLDSQHFESIRDLDIQLLQVKHWAKDEESIYEQCVESLGELYDRFVVTYSTRTGALLNGSMMLS
jgi:ASC-1-like (ASCH) protein